MELLSGPVRNGKSNWATLLARDIHAGLERKANMGKPIDRRYLPFLSPDFPLFQAISHASYYVWRHSVIVGSSGGSVAAGISQANPDRTRLLGYAHDSGKMYRTNLYVEDLQQGNRSNPPPVDTFPDLRTMLTHPRLSQKYAWQYGLPEDICRLLIEHHGTVRTRIRLAGAVIDGHPEEDFTYCGPRPSTIDSAIVMCSDSVSAYFERQMDKSGWQNEDHSQTRIRSIVTKIVGELRAEEQLDERIVTAKDQSIIEDRLATWLYRFFHFMKLFGTPRSNEVIHDGRQLWPDYKK